MLGSYFNSEPASTNFGDVENIFDENHGILPSCSYKVESDEADSRDSGISLGSNCSSGELPTNFESLKVRWSGFYLNSRGFLKR